MHTATLPLGQVSKPRPLDGLGRGAVLALLVHLLLIAALAFGVSWHAHVPPAVSAELWSAVPQVAAPQVAAPRAASPPPPPAPSPTPAPEVAPPAVAPRNAPTTPAPAETARLADAQIALEKSRRDEARREATERDEQRQRQRRQETQKLEAKKQDAQKQDAQKLAAQKDALRLKAQRDKAEAERRDRVAQEAETRNKQELADRSRKDEAALAAQREAYLKRMQGQANAMGEAEGSGNAARNSGPSASYAGRIKARIKPNIVFTDSVTGNPLATVEVRCALDGSIVSRKLVKSSGNALWDEAVLRAIDKTETLPRDVDGRVPPLLQIDFKPRD